MFANKSEKLKNYIKSYYIPFMFLFIITFIISSRVGIFSGDDEVFTNSFVNNGGVIGWFNNYTALWSGRIVPHFILIVLLNMKLILWRLINSFMFSFMAIGIFLLITKFSDTSRSKTIVAWIICSLIFFIPVEILYPSAVWITGSVTYLWPMSCAFISIVPFKRILTGEENSKTFIIIAFFSVIYASYSEQSAAVMIAFDTILLFYALIKRLKVKWYNYVLYVLCIVNSIYSLTVIGNSVRSQAEMLKYYSDYDMLSIIDKVFLGIRVCFNEFYNSSSVFMLVLSVLIVMTIKCEKNDYTMRVMASIPLVYSALSFMDFKELFNFNNVNPLYVGGLKQYSSYVMAIMVIFIVLYLFYNIFSEDEFFLVGLMFFAAIACSVVMGFSPTVYASGKRIFFATEVLLILCIAALFRKYIDSKRFNKQAYLSILLIGLVLAARFIAFMSPRWI